MTTTTLQPWSVEEFFLWQETQDDRYELAGGFPAAMAPGATRRHDTVVVNIIGELAMRLRGTGYRPFSGHFSVETRPGRIRRPDAGVERTGGDPGAYAAREASVVFEVLESTNDFDRMRKIAEYREMPFLRHIVLIDAGRPLATLWSRIGQTPWDERSVAGRCDVVALPAIGVELPMRELYDRITFES